MSEKERIRIGLRMFSEGKELILNVEDRVTDVMWNQYTKCPHCNKKIRIVKWIEKWKGITILKPKLKKI